MRGQEWEPGDEMPQILERAERKGKIRQVLRGCAFLLSWPVVANLNLGLQERIVIGTLVLLVWAAWFALAHPRAMRRMVRGSRHPAPQGGYRGQPDQRGQGQTPQQGQRYRPDQYRQGQAAQGQQFQRNYPQGQPVYHPVQHPVPAQEPGFAPDGFVPDWEG